MDGAPYKGQTIFTPIISFVFLFLKGVKNLAVAGSVIVTNNPMAREKATGKYQVIFVEGGYRDVLIKVRDMVHLGHTLYTHPLAGSIKPNQTPYRTVAMSAEIREFSMEDSQIISNSITVCDKFAPPRSFPQKTLKDLQTADISLIWGAMEGKSSVN